MHELDLQEVSGILRGMMGRVQESTTAAAPDLSSADRATFKRLMLEAKAMLARRPDTLPTTPGYAYVSRLKMYRGEIEPEALFSPSDTADVQVATLSFGLGNWYMVHGDKAKAKAAFQRAIQSGGWPGFGFMVSEAELKRLK